MAKGRIVYVPKSVFEELDNIRVEEKTKDRSSAFLKMMEFSRIGREAKKLNRLFGGR